MNFEIDDSLQFLISSEECSMKFQSIALMIQHTFKSFKTIKSPTASFTVKIIRAKLSYSNRICLIQLDNSLWRIQLSTAYFVQQKGNSSNRSWKLDQPSEQSCVTILAGSNLDHLPARPSLARCWKNCIKLFVDSLPCQNASRRILGRVLLKFLFYFFENRRLNVKSLISLEICQRNIILRGWFKPMSFSLLFSNMIWRLSSLVNRAACLTV